MTPTSEPAANAAQIDYWNDRAGPTWARFQAQLDRQLTPLGREAARVLALAPGERVIDIGCGCGQSTIELAALVGPAGAVDGLDISRPMLDVAEGRPVAEGAARPTFHQLDVQSGDLGAANYDAAYSRFGVMFFSDPVAAFRNIRSALKPGGRLAFVCWRPPAENPFMQAPMTAAAPFLPPPPADAVAPDPRAPGPFAFADAERVRGILVEAGFGAVRVDPFDTRIGGSSIDQTVELTFNVGPLGAALREAPEARAPATAAIREALAAYDTPEGVLMPAAVWIVQAVNPAKNLKVEQIITG